jgi:tetratricopeptide (TPR) repeat protein
MYWNTHNQTIISRLNQPIKIVTHMRKLAYSIGLLTALSFTGCTLSKMVKMSKKQELTVAPSPLELHGDSVKFDMQATLPAKMLKKNTTYTINPSYKYGDQAAPLGELQFKSTDYPNAKKETSKASKNFSFAYQEPMQKGELVVEGVAAKTSGKSKKAPQVKIADGVITTSRLVKDVYYASYAPTGYDTAEKLIATNVEFYFQQGRSELRTSESKSPRGKFLDNFIAAKNTTRSVTITGTHSPEGAETINTRLSNDRAKIIQDFYKKRMKKYDYKKMADSIDFVLKPVVEDWTMFLALLDENKTLSDAQKDEIRNIVNSASGDFESKEAQLERLPSYKTVFNDIYPTLRTAKTEILTPKPKKTDEQIAALSQQVASGSVSADTLDDEEILHAATLTPDLDEKEKIFKAAVTKNDSWQAHNDLGAVYLERATKTTDKAQRASLADQAITHLQTSVTKQESADAYNNLAIASFLKGENAKGIEYIQKASSLDAGENAKGVNGVKGAIQIKMGKYDDAIAALSNSAQSADNSFNKGLAYLLKKDYTNAESAFNEAIELNANDALSYYGKAIVASRTDKKDQVVANLSKATSIDSALKAKAVEDLEFKKFIADQAVRDAIK